MIKEVLLQVDGFLPFMPSSISGRLAVKDFPYNRMGAIITEFKAEGLSNSTSIKKYKYREIIKNPNILYGFSDKKGYYALYDDKTQCVISYVIEKVDCSVPWTIERKKTAIGYKEYIVYFNKDDKFIIKDEALNYSERQ